MNSGPYPASAVEDARGEVMPQNDIAQRLLGDVQTALRQILPGLVGMFVFMALCSEADRRALLADVARAWWLPLLFAVVIGPAIYAVHQAVYFATIHKAIFGFAKLTNGLSLKCIRDADVQRWFRRCADGRYESRIQSELDKWAATCVFLYCSGWALLLIPSFVHLLGSATPTDSAIELRHQFSWIGGATVALAVLHDVRQTRREIWIRENLKKLKDKYVRDLATADFDEGGGAATDGSRSSSDGRGSSTEGGRPSTEGGGSFTDGSGPSAEGGECPEKAH